MARLNITLNGRSVDYTASISDAISDRDLKRQVEVLLRNGELGPWDGFADLSGFVVDRIRSPDGTLRLYIRPKVPFGAFGR